MARFRLRYQSTDLEMPEGEFVVGRSSSCHLSLDDALVSRRHAIFRVDSDGVVIEDLGSRNGVQVNGESIVGVQRLQHLDRVMIGGQELLLLRTHGADLEKERGTRPTLAGMTLDLPVVGAAVANPEEPTAHHGASVLDRIADKALALGRYDEAERMLARRLKEMLQEARSGVRKPAPDKLLVATQYALALAGGLRKPAWIDWVFDMHDACGALIDADVIDRLHELVRQVRYPGGLSLKRYMENLRARQPTLTIAQQFQVRRLEGLERVVGA